MKRDVVENFENSVRKETHCCGRVVYKLRCWTSIILTHVVFARYVAGKHDSSINIQTVYTTTTQIDFLEIKILL